MIVCFDAAKGYTIPPATGCFGLGVTILFLSIAVFVGVAGDRLSISPELLPALPNICEPFRLKPLAPWWPRV